MRACDLIFCSGLWLLGACHLAVPFDPQQAEFVSSNDANNSSNDAGDAPDLSDVVLQDQARAADGGLADAPQPAATCAPWPDSPVWSAPERLTVNTERNREQGVFLSADQRTIYFASDRPDGIGGLDIYRAHRDNLSSAFSKPVPLGDPVNTTDDEFRLVIAPDGTKAYLSRKGPDGPEDADILWADVDSDGTFGPFTPIQAINTTDGEHDPFIDNSDSSLYFGRQTSSNEAWIWVSLRDSNTATWGAPAELELTGSAPTSIGNPVVSQDGLLLFNGGAGDGTANVDLWYARRASIADSFNVVDRLHDLNSVGSADSTGYEGHVYLSPDACTIYFTSDRAGDRDIYLAQLQPQVR